jgi:hypothetical protein
MGYECHVFTAFADVVIQLCVDSLRRELPSTSRIHFLKLANKLAVRSNGSSGLWRRIRSSRILTMTVSLSLDAKKNFHQTLFTLRQNATSG